MKCYDGLLTGPSRCKRGLIDLGLKLTENGEMHSLMIPREPSPACADSNLRLKKLLDRAVPEARRAIESFLAFCREGTPLPPSFDRTFGAGAGWQSIPVLPYEQEVGYEV